MKCRLRSALSIKFNSDFSSNRDFKKQHTIPSYKKGGTPVSSKEAKYCCSRALAFSRHSKKTFV